MTDAVTKAEHSAAGIEITRVFDAPRQLVWDAWTRPERFAQWFGERNSHMPLETASMDVRVGGTWSVIMVAPLHGEIPFGGEYLEVVEPERLVLTLKDPSDPGSPNRELWTVVLTEVAGKTEMQFTHTGANLPAEEYGRAKEGTLIFFERLAELLAKS